MWPHLLALALGDVVVVVGTDDEQLAVALAPWLTTLPADFDLSVVDFTAELHPPPPARSVPRSIPVVHHGTVVLARSTDIDELRSTLLRVLGELATHVPDGRVRLTGVPLLRDGAIELAAPYAASSGSRALRRSGLEPLYSGSVIVDPGTLMVCVAAPLGSSAGPTEAPLRAWWSELPDAEPPWPFGQLVAMTIPRTRSMATEPATSAQLAALVALMERMPPRPESEKL